MLTSVRYCSITLVSLVVLLAGCEKSDPVQLVDPAIDGSALQIEPTPTQNEAFSLQGEDSTGFFVPSHAAIAGRLIIAGSEYDTPYTHHEASLARAELFDRTRPEIDGDDTVGYYSFELGYVALDDLPLTRQVATYTNSLRITDTLGAIYGLLNHDGVGGRGFSYSGLHTYTWRLTGSEDVAPFGLSILAPERIHVNTPVPTDMIYASQNLRMAWRGGGSTVRILISSPGPSGVLPRNLLLMRVKTNSGSVVVPSKILRLLPQNQSRFLFTVIAENDTTLHIDRYADDIVARVITSHTLLLHLKQ